MKALKVILVFQILEVLLANPITRNITRFDEVDLSWRLPKAIYPISYYVELETSALDENNRDYSGTVIIHVDVRETTKKIVLHSKELNVLDVLLIDNEEFIDELIYYSDETRDFFIIETLEDIRVGDDLLVLIEFTGNFNSDGFYRSDYVIDGETKHFVVTNFGPTHARSAFPVFDGISIILSNLSHKA